VKQEAQKSSHSPQEIHSLVANNVLHYPQIYSLELLTLSTLGVSETFTAFISSACLRSYYSF